uniref:Aspartyl beta-hydroxylase n=1 Tax=Mizugakiibacter sediminis TaxID=1475481 RepID=A0A0U1PAL2_9GAMM
MHIDLLGPKFLVLYAFLAAVLYVHFRGKVRLPFLRQLVNHSAFLAPYNVLAYLFSKVPARPYLERGGFPELDVLKANWQTIRDEALRLSDAGFIRAAAKNNDASFNSFFKEGWKRFYLKWYDEPLPSARALCPKTVELVRAIPSVKAAMFTLLPPGAKLNPHRDPFAGSVRYHLGLITPNSDACRIFVDGEPYAWRDGEDVLFDETYVHWAENRTGQTRVILFCDVERPLRTAPMRALNRWIGGLLGRATATQNLDSDRVGVVNRVYGFAHTVGEYRKRLKRANKPLYHALRLALALGIVWFFVR